MNIRSKIFTVLIFIQCVNFNLLHGQQEKPIDLTSSIKHIIDNKKADIGISIIGPRENDRTLINANKLYPMLSTVKYPLALTILSKVKSGELSLNQKIFIKKEDLMEGTWSPFKKQYPKGDISINLAEALKWMIVHSDNNLTDVLFRLVGGPEAVQRFIGRQGFVVKNTEKEMHQDWDSQFENKITPRKATLLLKYLYNEDIFNKENAIWLCNLMEKSTTGLKRLKGSLPDSVPIAHRAGTSFTNDDGLTGAINDLGIIELPNKEKIYIAIFVHNSLESFDDSEEVIAEISKATYNYYIQNP